MELIIANSRKEKIEILTFYKSQYLDNPLRRDSLSGLLKGILFETSVMSQSIKILPLMVKKDGIIIMSCILAKALRMEDYLQISFFESRVYNKEAFDIIYSKAVEISKLWNTQKICASLNIHVNYGLGFLADSYDKPQSFGMAHNDEFIHRYFNEYNFQPIPMVTFYKNMEKEFTLLDERLRARISKRYTVRPADFNNMEHEAKVYTRINNDAFKDHPFYYKRVEAEDLELFKDFKLLLKKDNLIFVERDGKEVGFMLWYPDFHQIMDQRETIGLKTVINTLIKKKKLTKFKIVEMGIIKEEQKKGAILALFDYCFNVTKGRFKSFESGWVLKENIMSGNFGYKWADGVEKNYVAYVKELK
ncbi:hypothetical protein [Proteocatella sphenisci]|uniref:hypothetical protein n=1 Tax=Proteocatella sphenisci TaxID=181070 RepID=UPI00048C4176|nr:hypothetical protein [Proteocatella sphenisci]